MEGGSAAELFERIFVGYGDDSVAQLGARNAVEWVLNVLTKIIQRPGLAAYLEQSTRYIAYDGATIDLASSPGPFETAPERLRAARILPVSPLRSWPSVSAGEVQFT